MQATGKKNFKKIVFKIIMIILILVLILIHMRRFAELIQMLLMN